MPELTYLEMLANTRHLHWQREGETLETLHETLDLHFSLFSHPTTLEDTEETKLPRVWISLTTSAFHSSRVALYALESGYYTQCFALTRSVFEDWLTASDYKEHPETVEALFDANKAMPRFSVMCERLSPNLKPLWGEQGSDESIYGFLSTFAHPRHRAIEDTRNREGRVRIVPEYDDMRFALAARHLVIAILLLMDYLARLADFLDSPESKEWNASQLKTVKPKGFGLLESLNRRMNSYLEEAEN